jgi:hypothetical protein
MLKKDSSAKTKQFLSWNLQGQHRREMPRKRWRRTIDKEAGTVASKWSCAAKLSNGNWRDLTDMVWNNLAQKDNR